MSISNFLGRESELSALKELWNKKTSSLVAITGRRRIGKSRLVTEFSKTSQVYIEVQGIAPAQGITNQNQLNNFTLTLHQQIQSPQINVSNWLDAFNFLSKQIDKKKKTIIFFDEISWMGQLDATFPGVLKIAWDTLFHPFPKLIVILCGSVSTWIDKNILNNTAFVGRFSSILHLEELPLPLLPRFFNKNEQHTSPKDMCTLFSITGGIPRYLEEINPQESVDRNISRLCFSKNGFLTHEFDIIFNEIFDKRNKIYKQIVESLIYSKKTLGEICTHIHQARSGVISEYLNDLTKAGFLAKDVNYDFDGLPLKTYYYRLKDNYLRFYLRYIFPLKNKIDLGLLENKSISSLREWYTISGLQFENLILNNSKLVLDKLKIDYASVISISPYYQKKTTKNKGNVQIDLLINTCGNCFYICEIKFKNKINYDVVKEIQQKIAIFKKPKYCSVRTVLIYCGDISEEVTSNQEIDFLLSFDDLIK